MEKSNLNISISFFLIIQITFSALIKTAYAHNTVPIILYCDGLGDEEVIGGADIVIEMYNSGELREKLERVTMSKAVTVTKAHH